MLSPKVGERWWFKAPAGFITAGRAIESTNRGTLLVRSGIMVYELSESDFICRYRGPIRRLLDRLYEFFARLDT